MDLRRIKEAEESFAKLNNFESKTINVVQKKNTELDRLFKEAREKGWSKRRTLRVFKRKFTY
jgi:hypothetical protein